MNNKIELNPNNGVHIDKLPPCICGGILIPYTKIPYVSPSNTDFNWKCNTTYPTNVELKWKCNKCGKKIP